MFCCKNTLRFSFLDLTYTKIMNNEYLHSLPLCPSLLPLPLLFLFFFPLFSPFRVWTLLCGSSLVKLFYAHMPTEEHPMQWGLGLGLGLGLGRVFLFPHWDPQEHMHNNSTLKLKPRDGPKYKV